MTRDASSLVVHHRSRDAAALKSAPNGPRSVAASPGGLAMRNDRRVDRGCSAYEWTSGSPDLDENLTLIPDDRLIP